MKDIFLIISQRSIMTAVFFASLLIISCKKEDSDIGLLVQPPEDAMSGIVTDTFQLVTSTHPDDSIRTDEASNNMVGSYVDPVFGKTTAGFYTEFRLPANNPVFAADLTVDSVVLTLVYNGHYGTLDPQTFKVHQMTEQIYKDSSYYNTSITSFSSTDLMDPSASLQVPDMTSSFYDSILSDSIGPHLRLRLNNSVGTDLFNESGTGNLADNDAFNAWFRGLYITADNPSQMTGEGAVFYINTLHSDSRLTIYYHNSVNDAGGYQLLINEFASRYTVTSHDYTGTVVGAALASPSLGMNEFYMQAGGGVASEIRIPGLDNLINQEIAVNYAELILPAEYFSSDLMAPIGGMIIFGIDAEGEYYSILDLNTFEIFGGRFDATKNHYSFVITRHIQDILKGKKPNLGLRLLPEASSVTVKRTVLNGQQTGNRDKPYLKLIYTKY